MAERRPRVAERGAPAAYGRVPTAKALAPTGYEMATAPGGLPNSM